VSIMDATSTIALADLPADVTYKLSAGGTSTAIMTDRVKYPRPCDQTYPHPYRSAWNGIIFLSFTQAAIDRGDVWPTPAAS